MMFVQIILVLVFLFLFFKTFFKLKHKELFLSEAIGWMFLWFFGLILAFKPDNASYFAKILGIGRGVDLVIYAALIILFYLQFRLMIRIEKNNRDITKLTREKTLENKK